MKTTVRESRKRLKNKLVGESTKNLIHLAETLNLSTDAVSIVAANAVDRELENRLDPQEFETLQNRLEAELMAE